MKNEDEIALREIYRRIKRHDLFTENSVTQMKNLAMDAHKIIARYPNTDEIIDELDAVPLIEKEYLSQGHIGKEEERQYVLSVIRPAQFAIQEFFEKELGRSL